MSRLGTTKTSQATSLPSRWRVAFQELQECALVRTRTAHEGSLRELSDILAVSVPCSDVERGWVAAAEFFSSSRAASLAMLFLLPDKRRLLAALELDAIVAVDRPKATLRTPYPLKVLARRIASIDIPTEIRRMDPQTVTIEFTPRHGMITKARLSISPDDSDDSDDSSDSESSEESESESESSESSESSDED